MAQNYRSEKTAEQINKNFKSYPLTEDQEKRQQVLRGLAKGFAREINNCVPDGREKATSLTNLEQSLFWAIEGIARNE